MELNVVNGGSQVPVAPATARAARMLLGACGRCAAPLGRLHACGARMRVVVSAMWQAVSVVSRARSCAASVPLQRGTQQSDRLTQRVRMDSPFTADQMAWLAASFAARPPLPSSVTPAASTAAGGSTPLSVPETGTSSAPTLTGSAPLLGTSSSSGTRLHVPMFTRVSVGHGLLSGGGRQGCWNLARALPMPDHTPAAGCLVPGLIELIYYPSSQAPLRVSP